MKNNYLVCYDIADECRLQRVLRYMKARGLHVQYSVFYCKLGWNDLQIMKDELKAMIAERKDDVRIYPLPAKLPVLAMGCGGRIPEGVELYLT
ncbi:MAG TPA: CRISPR-associated endonuclease Cas2 [Dissulfurispiraceae bacterium]|nr:CRISPR-associated endonuclease Cas2 [Dissulfurispiraceae bacterium]